jgi:5-methyltetrahydrofolate--homocysteine methyltransferase
MNEMTDLAQLGSAIETGDRAAARALAEQALADGTDPARVLEAMTAAMATIGGRFQRNEIFVPEMLVAARAMKEGMAVLEPALTASGLAPEHTVVLGTITGDLHDIGKNLVGMMLKGANLDVVDLGTNVGAAAFVAAAREHRASVVGISALLTTTMTGMHGVVESVHAELPGVRVVIGGAPVTAEYAASIGADGYAPDAATAVDVVRSLLERSQPAA